MKTAHHISDTGRAANRRAMLARVVLGAMLALVLAVVFAGYLRPEFVLDLANRFVLCF